MQSLSDLTKISCSLARHSPVFGTIWAGTGFVGTRGVNDLKQVSVVAVVLIVVLRLSIGWQFLYEGLWKYDTLDSPAPWSAEGYLKAAQGPFRDRYRAMTGDPDDLNWLDHDQMTQRWANWRTRFTSHYQLDADQQKELAKLIDPAGTVAMPLAALPASVDPSKFPRDAAKKPVISYDPLKKLLLVPGTLLPSEVETLKEMVNVLDLGDGVFAKRDAQGNPLREGGNIAEAPADDVAFYKELVDLEQKVEGNAKQAQRLAQLKETTGVLPINETLFARKGEDGLPVREGGTIVRADPLDLAFYKAILSLDKSANALAYSQRLTALLKADPDRVGVEWKNDPKPELVMGTAAVDSPTDHNVRYGEIQAYKDLIQEYETALAKAQVDYQLEHASRIGTKLAAQRAVVVGPVKALDAQLQEAAKKLLNPSQYALGAMPSEGTPVQRASRQAMWGLLILGTLLLLGLGTRVSAIAGAVMLLSFYLVVPPWPGVPQPPGPEHSFIVNKNLIEALALIAIAALPTGSWFGLDGLIRKLVKRPEPTVPSAKK